MSKNKVYENYEKIHEWFDAHRNKSLMKKEYLNLILAKAPKQGTVLDLGCGTAEPLAAFFIDQGYSVTGVDGSTKMIALCKARFSDQTWLCEDMREIDLQQQFDVILAWHSFFHLPQSDQRKMFAKFAVHLKPGGVLAFTSGPDVGEVWSDNGGQNLYHASLSIAEYQSLLKQHGFEVLVHKVEDPDCGEATVWVVQKQKSMPYNWLEHWDKNDIGFHQSASNPFLKAFWPTLNLKPKARVLVPLCGKSLDLLWLADQGFQVIGIELSELACQAFFHENKLEVAVEAVGPFKRYYNEQIQIFCGDFFAMTPTLLSSIDAVYDRAALVALPEDLRWRYAQHLKTLLMPNSQILLITFDANNAVQGPPYVVSQLEVEKLFAPQYHIHLLQRVVKLDLPQHLCQKGYSNSQTFETVYRLAGNA